MAGTAKGGLKAAATNRKRYGRNFYAVIGHRGGINGHAGGFATNPELARRAGAIGGRRSKRGATGTTNESRRQALRKMWRLEQEFNAMFNS